MKETVNVTEKGTGTGRETESGRERGTVNGTGIEIAKENGRGKGIGTGTETVTERKVALLEMWSMPLFGDQVGSS